MCVSHVVRKVVHYSLEMEALGVERAEKKMEMCERLGDLCCSLRAFPAAIKFYEQQVTVVSVAEKGFSRVTKSKSHCSAHIYSRMEVIQETK